MRFVRLTFLRLFIVAAIGGSLLSPVGLAAQRPRDPLAKTYAEAFELIQRRVRESFYDRKLHGVDWDELAEKYRPRVGGAKTKRDFARLVNAMLNELHASHCELLTDDEFGFYLLSSVLNRDMEGRAVAHIGVMGRQEGDEYVVTGVLDGGSADQAGVLAGDRIRSVEGEPFSTVGAFRGREGRPVALALMRPGEAQLRTVNVTPRKENMLRAFLEATRKSVRTYVIDGKRIGYAHLWTMGHEIFKEALDQIALGSLYNTEGMILDLRDGFGGTPWGFSEVFFNPDIAWEQDSRGQTSVRRTGYGKPMVVLTNEGTRSAKEFLSYQFKKSGRAVLVGTPTAGAFLGASGFPVHAELLLEIPVVGLRLDGNRLEGKGVAPDVRVEAQNSYTEQDAQLQKAKQTLLQQIRASRRLLSAF